MAFNLFTRSDNTFLKSNIKVDDIISFALKNNMKECALIDFKNMYGTYEFYNKCLNHNLKPIIGVEYPFFFENNFIHLAFIAISEKGYFNLVKITSIANTYNKEYLKFDDILNYFEGLAIIIPSFDDFFYSNFKSNNFSLLNLLLDNLKKYNNDLYLGIYRYKGVDKNYLDNIKDYFTHNNILSLAMQYATHKNKDDTIIINLLDSISKNEPGNKEFLSNPFIVESYLKNDTQLAIYYDQDELNNLSDLTAKINFKINRFDANLPNIDNDLNPNDILKEKALKALNDKNIADEVHQNRVNYELDVIIKMGFAKYYLIVADYVNYAKSHNIAVGPSRGSGGASLVAYLLNITSYDPLKYDLLFERFLNPSRTNYPDFDIDFEDIKRDDVINYIKDKYGQNNVAHIVTFSTFGINSSLRDIAKLFKVSNRDIEYLLSFLSKKSVSLMDEYKTNEKFKNVVDIHTSYKNIVAFAMQIEGLKRQSSTHASGIIISKNDLTTMVPVSKDFNSNLIIQYDYQALEALNLIKFDFLGVTDVTMINYCLDKINKQYNLNYNIDNYPYDEKSTYDFITTCNIIGLSQIESKGMQKVITKVKPNSFNDLADIISLYRPGPMDNIETYIYNKNHPDKINYIDDLLVDILKPTYGVIIYQEQIMQIVQKVASYSLAEADLFRRAISKKKETILKNEKEKFIKRALDNNLSINKANQLFDYIYKFASYGFNKAHAVGYAIKVAIMASIKLKYPLIFYKSMLDIRKTSGENKTNLINEAKKLNVKFAFPSLNHSSLNFEIKDNYIQVGLANIYQINDVISFKIINEREKGLFGDFVDAIIRLVINDINIEIISNLIYAGAFDEFLLSRDKLLGNLETLYNYALMFKGLDYNANSYLTKYDYIKLPILSDYFIDKMELFDNEKKMLGFNITPSPLADIKLKQNKKYLSLNDFKEGMLDICLVRILNVDKKIGKDNKNFLTFTLEDETCSINARIYQNIETYESFKKNDFVEVLLKNKNNYFYINNMKKVN